MKKPITDILMLIRKSARQFGQNDPIMLAGALAFFTVFAIPPVLIIILFCIDLFTSHQIANDAVFSQIQLLIGQTSAHVLKNIVNHYFSGSNSLLQHILQYGIFIFASSSFFLIIQHAINRIWDVKPKPEHNFINILKNRALSFAIIIIMGVLLGLSLILRSLVFPVGQSSSFFATVAGVILSFVLGTLGVGVIYKYLPDVLIEWNVVWVGAGVTSFLFLLGQYIIGFALRGSNVQTMYGTVGSLAILLLWVFYSSIILFYGVAVTHQYALNFAVSIQPKPHAVRIKTKEISSGQ